MDSLDLGAAAVLDLLGHPLRLGNQLRHPHAGLCILAGNEIGAGKSPALVAGIFAGVGADRAQQSVDFGISSVLRDLDLASPAPRGNFSAKTAGLFGCVVGRATRSLDGSQRLRLSQICFHPRQSRGGATPGQWAGRRWAMDVLVSSLRGPPGV